MSLTALDEFELFGGFAMPPFIDGIAGSDRSDVGMSVIRDACEGTGVTAAEVLSSSRRAHIVEVRYGAMRRLRKEHGWTMARIGHLFNRDHTTVAYANKPRNSRDLKYVRAGEEKAAKRAARSAERYLGSEKIRAEKDARRSARIVSRAARVDEMERLYRGGQTLKQIGVKFCVTRERIRQCLSKRGMTRFDGGLSKLALEKRRVKTEEREAKIFATLGLSFEEYDTISRIDRASESCGISRERTIRGAFVSQRTNTRRRKLPWELSFAQWWGIWQASGKWQERGKGGGKYSLRMRDLALGYTVENSFIYLAPERRLHVPRLPRTVLEPRSPRPPKPPRIRGSYPRPASTLAVTESVLVLWAQGETSITIGARLGLASERVRVLVQRARAFGDVRAISRRPLERELIAPAS